MLDNFCKQAQVHLFIMAVVTC